MLKNTPKTNIAIIAIAALMLALLPTTMKAQAGNPWREIIETQYRGGGNDGLILIYYCASYSEVCAEMNESILHHEDVKPLLEKEYQLTTLSPEHMSREEQELARRLNFLFSPTLVILDRDYVEIDRLSGFVETESLVKWLKSHIPEPITDTNGRTPEPVDISWIYGVQVDAFQDYSNALNRQNRLRNTPLGKDARIEAGQDASNTVVYRIIIGTCSSLEEANQVKREYHRISGKEGLLKKQFGPNGEWLLAE